MKTRKLILLLVLNLTFLLAYSQNNDSLVSSIIDTTKSGYIIEIDTALVIIKVTNVKSGKGSWITKTDKIRVYIVGGSKLKGRWEIIDENNIRVGEAVVPISVIENIKKGKISKGGKVGIGLGAVALFLVVVAAIAAATMTINAM